MNSFKLKDPKSAFVLVVDDMSLGRLSARNILQQCGYSHITLAPSGKEAWNYLCAADETDCPFDLVLSDWIMPDINGFELVQKIKNRKWKTVPRIILVTAETEVDLVKQALQEGASGYVRKPLTLESLQTALKQIQ